VLTHAPPLLLCLLQETAQQFSWVALPQWKALSLSRHPVALPVADCAACSDIVAACKAKVSSWASDSYDVDNYSLSSYGFCSITVVVIAPIMVGLSYPLF
jgi:hypothetical protein